MIQLFEVAPLHSWSSYKEHEDGANEEEERWQRRISQKLIVNQES
jgi:hypothetical protein